MNIYAVMMFTSGAACGLLGVYSLRKRKLLGAKVLAFLLFSITLWSVAYGFELISESLDAMRVWTRISYPGISFSPVLFFLFIMAITDRSKWLSIKRVVLLFIVPTIMNISMWTNELHNLFYLESSVDLDWAFPVQKIVHGPVFLILVVYSYLMMIAGIVVLARDFVYADKPYREQLSPVFIASTLPLIFNAGYLLRVFPVGYIDLTPVVFSAAAFVLAISVFRHRLLDIRPIAKETLIENLRDGIIVIDGSDVVVDVNPAAREYLGISDREVSGVHFGEAFSGISQVQEFIESGDQSTEAQIDDKHYQLRRTPIYSKRGKLRGLIIQLTDITSRKVVEEALKESQALYKRLATTDMLTDVMNRYSLTNALDIETERSKRYGQPLSIIMFDLDDLKRINDIHGHSSGDEALKAIADLVRRRIRKSDYFGRWGGDEFLIVAPGIDLKSAHKMARKLRKEIAAEEISSLGKLSISMGVSSVDKDENHYDRVLRRADRALYISKTKGKNTVTAI